MEIVVRGERSEWNRPCEWCWRAREAETLSACGDGQSSSSNAMDGQENDQRNEASASRRKIELLREQLGPADEVDEDECRYRCFVEKQTLGELFSFMCCPECQSISNFEVVFGEGWDTQERSR